MLKISLFFSSNEAFLIFKTAIKSTKINIKRWNYHFPIRLPVLAIFGVWKSARNFPVAILRNIFCCRLTLQNVLDRELTSLFFVTINFEGRACEWEIINVPNVNEDFRYELENVKVIWLLMWKLWGDLKILTDTVYGQQAADSLSAACCPFTLSQWPHNVRDLTVDSQGNPIRAATICFAISILLFSSINQAIVIKV